MPAAAVIRRLRAFIDGIVEFFKRFLVFFNRLSVQKVGNTRAFEPDGPNFTPRISGVVKPDGNYNLSILKSLDGDPDCCCRYFCEYEHTAPGVGHFIHTYQEDVNPLPSFEGEPRRVAIPQASAHEWAQQLWASLNGDNKVSLYVSMIDVHTGSRDSVIINKHG